MCMVAASATGQEPRPGPAPAQQQQRQQPPEPERPPLTSPAPAATPYPLELFGLLAPPPGGATLVPSLALSEEWVDNVFGSNANKQSDFVTTFTPAVALYVNRPRYRLIAGTAVSAELHAQDSALNDVFGRQNFVLAGDYTATPALILRIADALAVDRNTSATDTFTVGRQLSLTNTLTPGLRWQITSRSAFDTSAFYSARRFFDQGSGVNSDTYKFQGNYEYGFTSRLTGVVGYGFEYLRIEGQDDSTTHTPTLGFGYRLTSALTVSVAGGPAITQIAGNTFISPAGTAGLTWRLRNGILNVQYSRSVGVAGGFGGTTDSQVAVATLSMPTWIRDLTLLISPSYTKSKSIDSSQATQIDVEAYRVNIGVAYQITRYVSAFGGYEFVRQRTANSSTQQIDADQNRVRIGLQIGYPFSLD
jgi:hypothetical protein